MKYKPKTKSYRHQTKATLAAVRQGNHAFFICPRGGKTKAALDAIAIQALRGRCRRVLVVTPLDGISVWEEELEKHFPFAYLVVTPDNTTSAGGNFVNGRRISFGIINYDKFRQRSREGKRWVYEWAKQYEDWAPDIVVLDESHRAKRAGAVTSQILWRAVERIRKARSDGQPYVYELTGTPNPKGYRDIFAQYRIMDSSIFGTNQAEFDEEYIRFGVGRRRWQVVRYENKAELLKKIRAHATIIPESKVEGMPRRVWQNVRVPLPQKARRLYEDMAEEFVAEWEGNILTATNAGVRRLRLQQITGGFTTDGREIHRAKLAVAKDVLTDLLEQEERIVVYARFLAEVDALERTLEKLGARCVAISGKTPRKSRAEARRKFQRGYLDALVFQVSTGSLAIDLSSAREILYYSLPDGWLDYYQSSKRTGKIGGTPTRIRHLVCPGTSDMAQLRGLRARADLHAELTRDVRAYLFGA